MKARPRSVERKVAIYLSNMFDKLTPVERIPVNGRRGPDISINELGLVIDVKSRIEIPKSWTSIPNIGTDGKLIGITLSQLSILHSIDLTNIPKVSSSIIVNNYYKHMDEWTKINMPNGVTTIILHKPNSRISSAIMVVELINLFSLQKKLKEDYERLIF